MKQWEFDRATGRCASTGRLLEEGAEFYTVLFEEGDSFRRVDFAADTWTEPPPGAFCHFKSRIPVKAKRKKLLVDTEVLINFFERLAGEEQAVRVQFRFVLALLLMRKRQLRYDSTSTKDEAEVWQMTLTRDQSVHDVVNPKLTDDQIEQVSRQVTAILHGDMNECIEALDSAAADGDAAGDRGEATAEDQAPSEPRP